MKLSEIKVLKEETLYKRVIDELKIKGLDKLYIKRTDRIDYLDIILAVINFLEKNKKVLKNVTQDQFENIVIIVIDEILEEIKIDISEEQIEKIIELLKNSLLVRKVSKYLIDKFKIIYNNIKNFINNKCCKDSNQVIESSKSNVSVK
jgi:uncharacterized protein YciU (UPF0263 family)